MKLESFYLSAYFGLILSEVSAQQQQKRTGLRARVRSTLSREAPKTCAEITCDESYHCEITDGYAFCLEDDSDIRSINGVDDSDDKDLACIEDMYKCPDGTLVSRDSSNDCEFQRCPSDAETQDEEVVEVACAQDMYECRDGTLVSRDNQDNCEFYSCPSDAETQEEEDLEGIMCAADTRECPDGSFVGRDSENNCEFSECKATKRPTPGLFANFGGSVGNPGSRPSFGSSFGERGPSDNRSPPNFPKFGGSFGGSGSGSGSGSRGRGNNNGGRFPNFGGFNIFGGN